MPNPYIADFTAQLRSRFADDSRDMSMTEWCELNTTLHKKKFTVKGYEFQRAILDDMSPNLCVIKISQVGLSEILQRKFAGFLQRNQGTQGIYTMPSDQMSKRFSQTRFGPLINENKVFNLTPNQTRSVGLYQLGSSFGYMLGNKIGDATSIPADLLFHDETSISDPEILALYQSRLQNSTWKIVQEFSTPTFEGVNIDAQFKISDQHLYIVKCLHCGHWCHPEWTPDHIHLQNASSDLNDFLDLDDAAIEALDIDASYVMCEKCHKPLDLGDPSLREWVPTHPGRRMRGYRVSPFATPRLPISYILKQQQQYQRRDALRHFYNTTLGQAYNDETARLSELDIRAIMESPGKPDLPYNVPVLFGLDMGLTATLTMMALTHPQPVIFHFEQIPEQNLTTRLEELRSIYNIIGGAVDRYPFIPLSNEIRDMFNGSVLPVEYTNSGADLLISKDELGNESHARGNRTNMLDKVSTAIRKRNIRFAGYGNLDHAIVGHLRDMVRVEKEDGTPVWQKLTGSDHFFHSLAYCLFSQKIHNLQLMQQDPRETFYTSVITMKSQNGDALGLKGNQQRAISLGHMP